jgi:hypothetical protein
MYLLPSSLAELCIEYTGKHEGFRLLPMLSSLLPISKSFCKTLQRFHADMRYADQQWVTDTLLNMQQHNISYPRERMRFYASYYQSDNIDTDNILTSKKYTYSLLARILLADFSGFSLLQHHIPVIRNLFLFGLDYSPEIAILIILDMIISNGHTRVSLALHVKAVLGKKTWNVTHPLDAFRKHLAMKICTYFFQPYAIFGKDSVKDSVKDALLFLQEEGLISNYISLPFRSTKTRLDRVLDAAIQLWESPDE